MCTTNIWDKYNLSWRKAVILFILVLFHTTAFGQESKETYLPNYDERWIHYGFLIGGQRSYYNIVYSKKFVEDKFDSVHSILPPPRLGFDLGFIVNLRLGQFFDFRVTPKVAFYEFMVEYNYTNGNRINQLVESTIVEMPLLIKYKSIRWTNARAYLIAGVMPGIQASGNKNRQEERKLQTADFNISGELGFGFDFYFPLFKFSPEIRFSKGLINVLREDRFGYSEGIESLKTNVFSLYLLFE